VSAIAVAVVCLVLAQVIGIYALVSRKADLVFTLAMCALLLAAVTLGGYGLYHRFH
jgi:hypothetical protein